MVRPFEFETILSKFPESPLWGAHIMVPKKIVSGITSDKKTRFIAKFNNKTAIHCALLSDGKGARFILINKELQKKLQINFGDTLTVNIKEDNSEYGMEMPEEFSEILSTDEQGSLLFHKLTPGKQRSLIYQVLSSKRSETRIKKALVILDYLKETRGHLDFKELNDAYKNSKY